MDITIQLPEKVSTNKTWAGMHWSKRAEMAENWHSLLLEYKNQIIDESDFPVHLLFIFTFKTNPLDWSNCSIMAKMLEDGMVLFKMIPDDKPKYVAGGTIISKKGDRDEVQIKTIKDTTFYESIKR